MTDKTPSPGNAPGLAAYLDDMQSKATCLSGILSAAAFLVNEGACKEGQDTLIFLSEDLALELTRWLDVVNRPEGAA